MLAGSLDEVHDDEASLMKRLQSCWAEPSGLLPSYRPRFYSISPNAQGSVVEVLESFRVVAERRFAFEIPLGVLNGSLEDVNPVAPLLESISR